MRTKDVIKILMGKKNITQIEITNLLGMKSQSGVSQALARDMKISMFHRFLDCLGCEIIVRDKTSGEEYLITE